MRNRSIQAIHTLRFPLAVHPNVRGPLQDALSGEFAAPFVTIPLQPWTLHELLPQLPEGVTHEEPPETACYGCIRSGTTFKCEGWDGAAGRAAGHLACPRHKRLPSQGIAISAYRRDISGYLEWKPDGDGELMQ